MDSKKKTSPVSNRAEPKDLNEVEMIGSPNSPRPGLRRPEVHHLITNEREHGSDTHHDKSHPDSDAETVPTQPLLPSHPDRDRQKPPLAGPEIDDLDGDERPPDNTPYPGIDDGLLGRDDKIPNGHDDHHGKDPEGTGPDFKHDEDDNTTEDGKWLPHGGDEPDFPYGDSHALYHKYTSHYHDGINGFGPGSTFDHERPISPMMPGSIIPDVNTYQQKKNLAQGMMDLALLSANANQLRYVLESSTSHPYYYPSVAFISLSILLQIAVGVGLIMNSRYNVKDEKDICKADKINNMTVLGVFLITIVNVFITSFSVATPNTTSTAVQTVVGSG